MNRILSFSLTLIFAMVLGSCSSKQDPVNELEELAYELKVNSADYSREDWQSTAEELELIESEIEQYKDEYTDEELKEIGRLKGVYLAQLTKYSIKSFKNGLEDAMKEAEGIMEGFKQGLEDIEE